MWKFKQFTGKEPTGLEGKTIDIGNVKIQIQNVIAEGGFSTVYLARDAINLSRHYALKHLICQDGESLALAMKEISVMKLLKGHPNVVTLVAHTILDMGRRKEALLVMEFCEKSLVNVLENRGSEFVEKQILLIFRDVCNAVFAMHSQTPPIAHRDLKAENVLLGSDGSWKLCDFGSTSSNHKRFDKPEEMGVEEDNIRKHTTPAYRAPEMWDLYRKDVISEKVDMWALGCLLFKLCYSKLAFDGESKLQILNGNYRIPTTPKYSEPLTKLIKDMLENSPVDRPDITQVWFRVNELLPLESQKDLPDGSISASAIDNHSPSSTVHDEGFVGTQKKSPAMPRRSPPPPPSKEQSHGTSSLTSNKGGGPMGAFWSTQHAQNAQVIEDKNNIHKNDDFEISFSPEEKAKPKYGNEAFNTFVADFDAANNINSASKSKKEEELEAEVASLKEKLKQANLEKDEITSKFEKLSAICRSQRQELQELKRNIPSATPSPASKDNSKTHETPQREKIEGTVWELQQGMFQNSSSPPDTKPWNAFAEVPKQQTPVQQASSPAQTPKATNPKSVRTTANGHRTSLKSQTPSPSAAVDEWGFGHDSFKAAASGTSNASSETLRKSFSKNGGEVKKVESNQPAGWAGF